jgi:DNA-binding response OmpR family regulator
MVTPSPIKRSSVLVVDDERGIRDLLQHALGELGFEVRLAACGVEALAELNKAKPDILILDLNMPDLSGEEVCQRIRSDPRTQVLPLLILTGRGTENLVSQCLDNGADDFLAKPFHVKELISRIRALLRRPPTLVTDQTVFIKGRLVLRCGERRALFAGHPIPKLSPKEFDLLLQLAIRAPNAVDKNVLALESWGEPLSTLSARTLDVHIRRIRLKLGKAARFLKTVPSIGYQWTDI